MDDFNNEMDQDEITSPLLSMMNMDLDSSNDSHRSTVSSSKKIIKPTRSLNDLLNFESDSDIGDPNTITPVEVDLEDSFNYEPNYQMMHEELEKELNNSDSLMSRKESTIESLSLEEIGHIRFPLRYNIVEC